MRIAMIVGVALLLMPQGAEAAKKKGMRFWNLTSETLVEVSLAPAGTGKFGSNQCLNDKDKSVDFDEDVAVTGILPGSYDIRTRDDKGRVCVAKAVAFKADDMVSIRDKDLTDCAK